MSTASLDSKHHEPQPLPPAIARAIELIEQGRQLHEDALELLRTVAGESFDARRQLSAERIAILHRLADKLIAEGGVNLYGTGMAGFNITKLADLVGLETTDVRDWIKGERRVGRPTDQNFQKLFRAHGIR